MLVIRNSVIGTRCLAARPICNVDGISPLYNIPCTQGDCWCLIAFYTLSCAYVHNTWMSVTASEIRNIQSCALHSVPWLVYNRHSTVVPYKTFPLGYSPVTTIKPLLTAQHKGNPVKPLLTLNRTHLHCHENIRTFGRSGLQKVMHHVSALYNASLVPSDSSLDYGGTELPGTNEEAVVCTWI